MAKKKEYLSEHELYVRSFKTIIRCILCLNHLIKAQVIDIYLEFGEGKMAHIIGSF